MLLFNSYLGNQVGTIIGRKGTKITQIREESACEIKVKGNDQDVERIILVAGLPSGIQWLLNRSFEPFFQVSHGHF